MKHAKKYKSLAHAMDQFEQDYAGYKKEQDKVKEWADEIRHREGKVFLTGNLTHDRVLGMSFLELANLVSPPEHPYNGEIVEGIDHYGARFIGYAYPDSVRFKKGNYKDQRVKWCDVVSYEVKT